MAPLRDRLAGARLYLVADHPSDDLLHGTLAGGVDIVQLRMKTAPDETILAAAARVHAACRRHGALFILNDRPDLVAAAGADGVHLGQDDVGLGEARALLGPEPLIGLSTHDPDQVDAAAGSPADYIGVGPVHATPTKPGRPAVGLELIRHAAAHSPLPFFAIGGITPGNASAVVTAGARRVAVVRALTEAADPRAVAHTLRETLGAETREGVRVGTT